MMDAEHYIGNSPAEAWETVTALVDENQTPSRRPEDELYRRGCNFLRRWNPHTRASSLLLKRDYPTFYRAHNLYVNVRSERWIIEAGLLTNVPLAELGQYVAQTPEVIEEYARFFFDVKDRLASRGYILNQVMMPAFARGMHQRDFDMMFKTVAYCMGWKLFTEFIDRNELSDAARLRIWNGMRDQTLKLGYLASHRMEINNFNAPLIMDTCIKLAELEHAVGTGAAQGEAMSLMKDLLNQCKIAIFPAKQAMDLSELRADELMGAAKQLKYGEAIPVGAENGQA